MIPDQDRYIGAAVLQLIGLDDPATISRVNVPGGVGFTINDACLVYLKYSTSRLTPWSFTFSPTHLEYLNSSEAHHFSRRVIGLICGTDGVAGLMDNELFTLVSPYATRSASATVSRPPRQHYHLTAGRTALPYTISKEAFGEKARGSIPDLSAQRKIAWPLPSKAVLL